MDGTPVSDGAADARLTRGPRAPRSLLPQGLRKKLMVAVSLMSVIPLLVLGYVLSSYVFTNPTVLSHVSTIAGLVMLIAALGFFVVRSVVFPVVRLSSQAQAIARGNLDQPVDTQAPDEVGVLGSALEQIAGRVRENLTQLRVYGEQTKHLNLEINRRIMAMSNLLQVSNLITQSAKVEEVRSFVLSKLPQVEEAELNCLLEPTGDEQTFVVRAAAGMDAGQADALLNKKLTAPWLHEAFRDRRIVVMDGEADAAPQHKFLQALGGMLNAVCQPLTAMGQSVGLLISANRTPGHAFDKDTLEILKIFAKQLSIAIENDLLTHRVEESRLIDEATGLYTASYMKSRLEEEIRRAVRYHRSCSLVVFTLHGLQQLRELHGGLAVDEVARQLAKLIEGQVSDIDRVGRLGPDVLAVILPERNRREAAELAEALRRRIEDSTFTTGRQQISHPFAVTCGISENPVDGATGEELFTKALETARATKPQGHGQLAA